MDERSDREILLSMEKRLEYLEHKQKISTRLGILKIAVILAIVAVLAVVLTPYIREFVINYRALMAELDKLNGIADSITAGFDSLMEKLEPVISFFTRK